jgi:hypothetical protein
LRPTDRRAARTLERERIRRAVDFDQAPVSHYRTGDREAPRAH